MTYLHTSQVTVPFGATDHTTRNILICESKITAVRQICSNETLAQADGGVKGFSQTYLTYLDSLAGPNASADGCLHTEMPNASVFLCSPLRREK